MLLPLLHSAGERLGARGLQQVRFAHKKAGGLSRNGRDSPGQHLGPKATHGELVKGGRILVRQRGFAVHPGANVVTGKDGTLNALISGQVVFSYDISKRRTVVSIEPVDRAPGALTINQLNAASASNAQFSEMRSFFRIPGRIMLPTKQVAHQRVKEAIPISSYLSKSARDRYLYVNQVIRDLTKADKENAVRNAESTLLSRRRPFSLTDVTLF